MELIKKVNAYMALSVLSKEKFSYKDAYSIATLKQNLKEDYEFFSNEERALVSKVSKKDGNGKVQTFPDGHFEFENEEKAKEYNESMRELSMLDTTAPEKIKITPPSSITPELLEVLLDFIDFEEE